MKFLREYRTYQLYKVEDIDISDLGSEGESRLIKNDILVYLPDTVIELGNETQSFKFEDEAIEYIDNNPDIQEKFKNAMERSEQENKRQEEIIRHLKDDERRKYERKRRYDYEHQRMKHD